MRIIHDEQVDADGVKTLSVKVIGDMTINHAEEIRNDLINMLNCTDRLALNISEISSLDVAGLQLIAATRHSATELHKTLELDGTDNAVYLDIMHAAGFGKG